ncbi:hypothetical protein HDU96_000753 [Phlyctochytrium bullatum]|nr:hypothetical protein HDU96_000753 [Phlyctochytrium bullatum]
MVPVSDDDTAATTTPTSPPATSSTSTTPSLTLASTASSSPATPAFLLPSPSSSVAAVAPSPTFLQDLPTAVHSPPQPPSAAAPTPRGLTRMRSCLWTGRENTPPPSSAPTGDDRKAEARRSLVLAPEAFQIAAAAAGYPAMVGAVMVGSGARSSGEV